MKLRRKNHELQILDFVQFFKFTDNGSPLIPSQKPRKEYCGRRKRPLNPRPQKWPRIRKCSGSLRPWRSRPLRSPTHDRSLGAASVRTRKCWPPDLGPASVSSGPCPTAKSCWSCADIRPTSGASSSARGPLLIW